MFENFKRFFIAFSCFALFCSSVAAETIVGKVKQDDINKKNSVVDSTTKKPISGADISIPALKYNTKSANDGTFELNANIDSKTIMSVQKKGYRPFSLTIDKAIASKPLKLGIEKTKEGDMVLEADICHLGDDIFSDTSANSAEFIAKSVGPFYSKNFKMAPLAQDESAVIILGTVIGLDTKAAREMGQNRIASVYSSPADVYFNNQKIAELNVNGDNIEINVPRQLIRENNELTIKTGKNLFQHAYIDYDDIEIANIRLEVRQNNIFANK